MKYYITSTYEFPDRYLNYLLTKGFKIEEFTNTTIINKWKDQKPLVFENKNIKILSIDNISIELINEIIDNLKHSIIIENHKDIINNIEYQELVIYDDYIE